MFHHVPSTEVCTHSDGVLQDSLTKTIPIWAAVLNRAVAQLRSYHDSTRLVRDSAFVISSYPKSALTKDKLQTELDQPISGYKLGAKGRYQIHSAKTASSDSEWDSSLHLPPWVSSNERIQIEAKLDHWVRQLCQVHRPRMLSPAMSTIKESLKCLPSLHSRHPAGQAGLQVIA